MPQRMKCLLAALLFATSAFAQRQSTDNLARPLTSTPQILIPAAGSVRGAGGTFFRSDINIVNVTGHTQRVRMQWLPQGVSGAGITPREIDVPAASGFFSEDFVGVIMEQTGLGAILVTGITSEEAFDPTARLFATSRIWTPQPNATTGTNSQSFITLDTGTISSTQQWIFGVRRDDRYRANVGIVNLSQNLQRFSITVVGTLSGTTTTTELEVPGFAMQQAGITAGTGALQIVVTNISAGTREANWMSYASSIDNTTGDSWSMLGFTSPNATP